MDLITQRFLMAAAGASAGGGQGAVSTVDVPNSIASNWQIGNASIFPAHATGMTNSYGSHRNLVYASELGKYFYLFPNGIVGKSTDGITWSYETMGDFLEPNTIDPMNASGSSTGSIPSSTLIWTGTQLVGSVGQMIVSSVDGNTWELKSLPLQAAGSNLTGTNPNHTIMDLYFNGTYYYISAMPWNTYNTSTWVAYSTDLVTWTRQLLSTESNRYGVAAPLYSSPNSSNVWIARSGVFVSYSSNNFTSNTYTNSNPNYMTTMKGVTQGTVNGNTVIVFAGSQHVVRSNANGNTQAWVTTALTGIPASNGVNGIAYGNNMFVVVGSNGYVFSSPNTDVWSTRTSNTKNDIYNVQWTGSKFIAMTRFLENLSSPDGITWTNNGSPLQKSMAFQLTQNSNDWEIRNIDYSPTLNLYLAGGPGYGNTAFDNTTQVTAQRLATSTDGLLWSNIGNPPSITTTISSVSWTGNEFVVGSSGGNIYTTSNTITWKTVSVGATIISAAGNGSKIIALDNITTTSSVTGRSSYGLKNKGTNNTFGKTVWVSTDSGTSWVSTKIYLAYLPQAYTYSVSSITFKDIRYNSSLSKFILTYALDNKQVTATSIDGVDWIIEPIEVMVEDVVYFSNNYYVLSAGSVYKSSDMVNFTDSLRNTSANSPFYAIANTSNTLVAITSKNGIYTTSDGTSWSKPYLPFTPVTLGVTSVDGNIVVGCTLGNLYSNNGQNWNFIPTSVSRTYPITYGGSTYHITLVKNNSNYNMSSAGDDVELLLYSHESTPDKWNVLYKSTANNGLSISMNDFCVDSTGNNQIVTVGMANSTHMLLRNITFNGNANSSTVQTASFAPPGYTILSGNKGNTNPSIYRNTYSGKYFITWNVAVDQYPSDNYPCVGYISSSSWNGSYTKIAEQLTWYDHQLEIISPYPNDSFIMTEKGYSLDNGVTWHMYSQGHNFDFIGRNTTGLYAVTAISRASSSGQAARRTLWKKTSAPAGVGDFWESFGHLNVPGDGSNNPGRITAFATGSNNNNPTFCFVYEDGNLYPTGEVTSGNQATVLPWALSSIGTVKWIQSKGTYVAISSSYNGRIYYSTTGASYTWSVTDIGASTVLTDITYLPQGDRYIATAIGTTGSKPIWVSSSSNLSTATWTQVSIPDAETIHVMSAHYNGSQTYFYAGLSNGKLYYAGGNIDLWYEISTYSIGTEVASCLVSDGGYVPNMGTMNNYIFGYGSGKVVYSIGGQNGETQISNWGIVSAGIQYDDPNSAVVGWAIDVNGVFYRYKYSAFGGNSYQWETYKSSTDFSNVAGNSGNTITVIKSSNQRHSTNTTIALAGGNYLLYTPGANVANLSFTKSQV